jgi:acyl-coenzyme A synthetase/AMP-(fatty) acid ligase
MPPSERHSLLDCLSGAPDGAPRSLYGAEFTVDLNDLALRSALGADPRALRSRSLLIHTRDALSAAVALVELDGAARRIVLCPPGIAPDYLPAIATTAEVDGVLCGAEDTLAGLEGLPKIVIDPATLAKPRAPRADAVPTQWILLTSGTSGVPKLVVHTLGTLAGAIASTGPLAGPLVWSTFYDIRRYGGLQILLRALIGGGSLVLTDASEAIDEFLARAARAGVTHITGTPSHWRRALMGSAVHGLAPRYARMSGEIADQAIIDRLRACYPRARVAHAFASTEAGVGFEVDDGLEGFPQELVGRAGTAIELKVEQDTLRIRSPRTGLRYLGAGAAPLQDEDGFVDTGDVVELRGGRYYFVGRRGGIINVGGLKVHPEEVEAVINRHPQVRMSLVKARKNPITGSLVVAEVVPVSGLPERPLEAGAEHLKTEILDLCRAALAPYKVPASIRIVSGIDVTPSGKLTRVEA